MKYILIEVDDSHDSYFDVPRERAFGGTTYAHLTWYGFPARLLSVTDINPQSPETPLEGAESDETAASGHGQPKGLSDYKREAWDALAPMLRHEAAKESE